MRRIHKIAFGMASIYFTMIIISHAFARDDGRYAGSPLKDWFDNLTSNKGLCCSMADGETVSDPDWESRDGHYRVFLENKAIPGQAASWIDVPDEALITEPNKAQHTMVWPIYSAEYGITIRCFMPGSMT